MDADFGADLDEGSGWTSDQVSTFFDAFQQHGQDWIKVCLRRQTSLPCALEGYDQRHNPAGLAPGRQDCPAMRGTIQAALLVLEPCHPTDPKGSLHGHGQRLPRTQLTGKHHCCFLQHCSQHVPVVTKHLSCHNQLVSLLAWCNAASAADC